jgi:hypothetical protein
MATPILSCDHSLEAMAELRAELAEFSFDGLMQLRDDLATHSVLRGSWAGCVISYKSGAPGSCRRDRRGRARNAFTVLWDNGWLSDGDVASAVAEELTLRRAAIVTAKVDSASERSQPRTVSAAR